MIGLVDLLKNLSTPFQWWVVIAPWEQGVRVRLGRNARLLLPGIHLKIPWLDRVYVASVRVRLVESKGQTVMSSDGKAVSVAIAIQFAIRDLRQLFSSVSNPEATLMASVKAEVAEVIARLPAHELNADQVSAAAAISVPEDWGLSDVSARITSVAVVRTYRILNAEWDACSGLDGLVNLDEQRRMKV